MKRIALVCTVLFFSMPSGWPVETAKSSSPPPGEAVETPAHLVWDETIDRFQQAVLSGRKEEAEREARELRKLYHAPPTPELHDIEDPIIRYALDAVRRRDPDLYPTIVEHLRLCPPDMRQIAFMDRLDEDGVGMRDIPERYLNVYALTDLVLSGDFEGARREAERFPWIRDRIEEIEQLDQMASLLNASDDQVLDRLIELLAAGMAEEAEKALRQIRESRESLGPPACGYPLNPEAALALEFLQQNLPGEYREFIEALAKQPAERSNLLQELLGRYQHAMELQRENPATFERELELRRLEGEAWATGQQIQDTKSEEEKQALENELFQMLNRIFDARQGERRKQIEEMRSELEELEQSVKRLDENREKAIEKKFREMTGEEDELDFM
jgi:hypothetical protein